EMFMRAGAQVEICGRNTPDELSTFDGIAPIFTPVDVRDEEQISQWMESVAQRNGSIDGVVNNAGGAPIANVAEASSRFHRKVNEINFLAAAFVAQTAFNYMDRQDTGGTIVNISSVSAHRPSPGTAVYGAAKAALESLTSSLAVEWAPRIRVNAV